MIFKFKVWIYWWFNDFFNDLKYTVYFKINYNAIIMNSFIGGLKIYYEMRRHRLQLRPFEPQGLQALPRTWD